VHHPQVGIGHHHLVLGQRDQDLDHLPFLSVGQRHENKLRMIWKYDHVAPLTWPEYHYWMHHRLPTGWAIIAPPLPDRRK
jgi:hypothetical protein